MVLSTEGRRVFLSLNGDEFEIKKNMSLLIPFGETMEEMGHLATTLLSQRLNAWLSNRQASIIFLDSGDSLVDPSYENLTPAELKALNIAIAEAQRQVANSRPTMLIYQSLGGGSRALLFMQGTNTIGYTYELRGAILTLGDCRVNVLNRQIISRSVEKDFLSAVDL